MAKILQELSFDENDNTKEAYIVYRIQSDKLDPNEITNEIGIKPDIAYYKGEKYIGKGRDQKTKELINEWRKAPIGRWVYTTENKITSKRVEEHILYLLDRLEPVSPFIGNLVKQPEIYSISIFIKWASIGEYGGYQITNNTIIRIAKLCHFIDYWFSSEIG